MIKKLLAGVMALTMLFSIAAPAVPVNAQEMEDIQVMDSDEETRKVLGTREIADPSEPINDSDLWKGSYVYFGTFDVDGEEEVHSAEPVRYRVLDSDTTEFGGNTMFLDCDTVLLDENDPNSMFNHDFVIAEWETCDLKDYLNSTFLTENFSNQEQNVIAKSVKSTEIGDSGYGVLNGEKIFVLNVEEVTRTTYGYSDSDQCANRKKLGGNGSWLLRSYWEGTSWVANVEDDYITESFTDDYVGVSPALNVNLSFVLLSSVISGSAGETGAEYKLTLVDKDITIVENGTITRNRNTVTVPYAINGDNSANVTQVSVMILDKEYTVGNTNNATILSYEKLDGTGTFILSSDLSKKVCGIDYYAYIIAEDVNGTYETDYSSEPVAILIPELEQTNLEKFVERMYTVALNRESDPNGKADWVGQLEAGTADVATLAFGFIRSPEFTNRNLDDATYLTVLYRTFFDREPDEGGMADWMGKLAAGASREFVLAQFVNSDECMNLCNSFEIEKGYMKNDGSVVNVGISKFVGRHYTKVLGRAPEAAGYNDWILKIINGVITPGDIPANFFGSQEYVAKNKDNSSYVYDLYATFFDRAPANAEDSYWIEKLNNGTPRNDIIPGFANSEEFANLLKTFDL